MNNAKMWCKIAEFASNAVFTINFVYNLQDCCAQNVYCTVESSEESTSCFFVCEIYIIVFALLTRPTVDENKHPEANSMNGSLNMNL